ncbi:MAG TPA: twin-arginine translocation signal domain-containing protein, partial [Pirellulales bacterium]|nr:twin-arginine translocation signal domain-containing protein [Pirellulales bacterium]
MNVDVNRRDFLKATLAAAGAVCAGGRAVAAPRPTAKADSVIFIWLPGGVAQTDTWDIKKFTPFRTGMRGNELLGTCPSIATEVDGLRLGAGLENMAS